MSWLCRLGWWPWLRPEPVIRIIENWVCLVVVVERRPQRLVFDEWSNCKDYAEIGIIFTMSSWGLCGAFLLTWAPHPVDSNGRRGASRFRSSA